MKISSVQYIRAFAALLVVYIHLTFKLLNENICGAIGVDIFFVTSGFIISYSIGRKSIENLSAGGFFKKRIRRIYPLYFFVTVCYIICLLIWKKEHLDIVYTKEIIKSLLFIPSNKNGYNDPIIFTGWSLIFEMYFYLIVTLSIYILKENWAKLAIPFFLLCSIIGFFYIPVNIYLSFLVSPFFLEFSFGVIIYYLLFKTGTFKLLNNKLIPLFFYTFLLLFLLVSFGKDYGYRVIGLPREYILFNHFNLMLPRSFIWGIPSALLFLFAILFFNNKPVYPKLQSLGDMSYSIYLIQVPVLFIYTNYYYLFNQSHIMLVSIMVLSVGLILAISYLTYYFIEKEKIISFLTQTAYKK